jgi:zinc transport system substrate-binding protein
LETAPPFPIQGGNSFRSPRAFRFPLSAFRFYCLPVQPLVCFALLFCAVSASAAQTRLHIVTGFLPLYCWTANVAGTNAHVENLLSARSEPHEYAFTPGDARKLTQADLIIVNGLGLEPWLPQFLRSSSMAREKIIVVSDGAGSELIAGEQAHRAQGAVNPHLWLDPQFAMRGVTNILAGMQRADPVHRDSFQRNASAYLAKLRQLDANIHQSLASVTNRAIVTYHDAFPYFARRYGLEIAGVVEQVPDVNPTPKYLSRLGRMMRERGIRTILVPAGGRTRLAQRIADDLRVELVELDTLESGLPSPSAYEERMRHNASVLERFLK